MLAVSGQAMAPAGPASMSHFIPNASDTDENVTKMQPHLDPSLSKEHISEQDLQK